MEIDGKYYEPRYVEKISDKTNILFFENISENHALFDLCLDQPKIVLLGNPGVGKSVEMRVLAHNIWSTRKETGIFPIFIDLKNFREGKKMDDYIKFKEWKTLPRVTFILDGLDEVVNIQDFISELENFISQNEESDPKYVVSCRTNIHDKYLIKIANFERYELKELNRQQINSILKNGQKLELVITDEDIQKTPIYKSPFFLGLLADFYKEHGRLPESNRELWELFINNGLLTDKAKQKRNPTLIAQLKKGLRKIAFVTELQHENVINSKQLVNLVDNALIDPITDNRLFEYTDEEKESLKFSHRQIQEYFVASILSELTSDKVIELISVPGVDAVNPSFSNVLSFLLSLYEDSDDYTALLNWLVDKAVETLIGADSDRISPEVRIKVFQDYFQKQCIDQTLWVNTSSSVSDEDLARFGDCIENSNYLIGVIINDEVNERARISGVQIISAMKAFDPEKLMETFFEILKNEKSSARLIKNVVSSMNELGLSSSKPELVHEVIEIFKEDTDEEINSALLNLVDSAPNVDEHFEYISTELKRILKIDKREHYDNVQRGNNWTVQRILGKVQNWEHFAELLALYVQDRNNSVRDFYIEQILDRVKSFHEIEVDFLEFLLTRIIEFGEKVNRRNEEFLKAIIDKCDAKRQSFEIFFNHIEFRSNYWLFADITDESAIDFLLQKDNLLDKAEVLTYVYFRNNLIHHNKMELAVQLQDRLIDLGYNFGKNVVSKESIQGQRRKQEQKSQSEFDLLFEPKDLVKNITQLYEQRQLTTLNRKGILDLEMKLWDDSERFSGELGMEVRVLRSLLFYQTDLEKENIEITIEKVDYRLLLISQEILGDKNNFQPKLNEQQKGLLQLYVNEFLKCFSFEGIFARIDKNGYAFKGRNGKLYFELFKQIIKLFENNLIHLKKNFLLRSLKYYEMDKAEDNSEGFKALIEKVDDKSLVDEQILLNLEEDIFSFVERRHWTYILDNRLSTGYKYIKESLLNDSELYSSNTTLKKYVNVTQDFDLLKEHCRIMDTYSSWTSLTLLEEMDSGVTEEFVLEKAVQYLENNGAENNSKEFNSYALRLLFKRNNPYALKYVEENLESGVLGLVSNKHYSEFNQLPENYISFIKSLFDATYSMDQDRFEFSAYQGFFHIYISNISKIEGCFSRIQEILNEIKDEVPRDDDDYKYFYINMLISISKKSYIAELSQPMSFQNARKRAIQLEEEGFL